MAATAFYAGQPIVGHAAGMKLLKENRVPAAELQRVNANLTQYEQIIGQMQADAHKYQQEQQKKEEPQKKKKYKQRK